MTQVATSWIRAARMCGCDTREKDSEIAALQRWRRRRNLGSRPLALFLSKSGGGRAAASALVASRHLAVLEMHA